MQTDETLGDHIVNGFVLPPTHIVGGDAMNKFAGQLTSRVATASDAFCGGNIQSPHGAMSFSSFPQISPFHGADRFLEAIPLPDASIGTFPYTSIESHQENTRYSTATNGLDIVSSSLETVLHGYGGLPFPPQLVGRVVGRTNLPPPAQLACSPHSREWPVMEQLGFDSHSHDSSQYSNELSLSLVTSRPSLLQGHSTTPEQCSDTSYSVLEHASSSSKSLSSGFKPLRRPPLLLGSTFLEAIQEILAEIACYALENVVEGGADVSFSSIGSSNGREADHTLLFQKQETSLESKRKHLLALLQMV